MRSMILPLALAVTVLAGCAGIIPEAAEGDVVQYRIVAASTEFGAVEVAEGTYTTMLGARDNPLGPDLDDVLVGRSAGDRISWSGWSFAPNITSYPTQPVDPSTIGTTQEILPIVSVRTEQTPRGVAQTFEFTAGKTIYQPQQDRFPEYYAAIVGATHGATNETSHLYYVTSGMVKADGLTAITYTIEILHVSKPDTAFPEDGHYAA